VHVDGQATRSCVTPLAAVAGQARCARSKASAGTARCTRCRSAWLEHQVPQCGYCQSGMLMAAAALLARNADPSDAEVDAAITNLCRCGTTPRVRAAIRARPATRKGPPARPRGSGKRHEPPALDPQRLGRGRRAARRLGRAAAAQPPGGRDALPVVDGGIALNGWIRIGLTAASSLAMPRSEMGQGVHTALAMLVAEELDVPLARRAARAGGRDSRYGNVSAAVEAMLPFSPSDSEPGRQTAACAPSRWVLGKLTRELG
jgi:hypothetical protein